MKLLAHLIACLAAVWLMQELMPEYVQYGSPVVLLAAGLILWLVNTLIRPLVKLLTLPLTIVTLGLFSLVVNTLMVLLAAALIPAFVVSTFWAALLLALLVSLLQVVIVRLFREDR